MLCRPVKGPSRCTLPAQMLRNGRLCLKAVHKARPIATPGPCHGYTKASGPGHGYRLRTRCLRSGPLLTAETACISDSLQVILISAHAAVQSCRHAASLWPRCHLLAKQPCGHSRAMRPGPGHGTIRRHCCNELTGQDVHVARYWPDGAPCIAPDDVPGTAQVVRLSKSDLQRQQSMPLPA